MKLFMVFVTGDINETSLQIGQSEEVIIQEMQEEYSYHGDLKIQIQATEVSELDGYSVELKAL